MAVSLLMFLPGVAGQWLDKRFGTGFLTLVGFGFGFCAGLVVLLVMVNPKKKSSVDVSESAGESSNELDQGSGKSE